MLITNLSTKESFNSFWNNQLPTLHGATRLTAPLYVLWKFKKIDLIKAHIENDISILNYVEQISCSDKEQYVEVVNEYNSSYSGRVLYIYPYTSTKFFNNLFKDVLPSAKDTLISTIFSHTNYKSNIVIDLYDPSSPTSFKACILSEYNPEQADLDTLNSLCFPEKSVQSDTNIALKDILTYMDFLIKDNIAYSSYVKELEVAVTTLSLEIDKHQKEGLNGYLLSWH
jgi:hypothetical protein